MFIKVINRLEEIVISTLLASMTLLVFIEVVMRYVFNMGLMWAEELTLYLSAWMVLFGVSYGIKVGSHIGVDAAIKLLPSSLRRIISGLAVIACLGYCGLFINGSWTYLRKLYKIGIELNDLAIPKWIGQSILLIGMLLIAIRLGILLWAIITGKAEGFQLADEAKESMHLAEETVAQVNQGGKSA